MTKRIIRVTTAKNLALINRPDRNRRNLYRNVTQASQYRLTRVCDATMLPVRPILAGTWCYEREVEL